MLHAVIAVIGSVRRQENASGRTGEVIGQLERRGVIQGADEPQGVLGVK